MNRVEPLSAEEALAASPLLQEMLSNLERHFGIIPANLRTMALRPQLSDGLYSGGAYSGGTQVASFTITGIVTGQASGMGGGPGGARPPRS